VAIDFEEDHYDIDTYRKDFPQNRVVGPIEPPGQYTPETSPEQRAALIDVTAQNSLLNHGILALLADLDRAEAALGVNR